MGVEAIEAHDGGVADQLQDIAGFAVHGGVLL
jgi:hypothetical protein